MSAPTPLRPQLLNPSELQWTDALNISLTPNGKYVNAKGLPNLMLKGSVKFISATESGRQKIGLAIAKEDAESLSTFCDTHLLPALASALAIPEPTAIALGRKKQKTSPTTPTVPAIALGRKTSPTTPTALQLKFYANTDKFESTKAIVNFMTNTTTQFYLADLEAQTGVKTDGVTQNADIEATCWMSISKSDKEEGLYYLNINPKQIVYVEGEVPKREPKAAAPLAFGGKELRL